MKQILIVTTEFGLEGGGISLSCTRLVNILSNNNYVEVADSLALPIATASGGKLTGLNKYIRMEYKLKTESQRYKDFDIIIGFGGRFNGYYASLLARQINAKYILCLRGSDINLAKWSIEDIWYLEEAVKMLIELYAFQKKWNIIFHWHVDMQKEKVLLYLMNLLVNTHVLYSQIFQIP